MNKEKLQKFNIIITLLGIFIFGIFFNFNNAFAFSVSSMDQVEAQLVSGTTYCISDTDYDTIQANGAYPGHGIYKTQNDSFPPTLTTYDGIGGNGMDCTGGYNLDMAGRGLSDGSAVFVVCTDNDSDNENLQCLWAGFTISGSGTLVNSNEIETVGITSSSPADNATRVNAYTTFTGTYDNDGFYNKILLLIKNLDQYNATNLYELCDEATTGTGVLYSCNIPLSTNTNYQFLPVLWNDSYSVNDYPDGFVLDTDGPYVFTTGLVYEVATPATSSTCSGFDLGCYLENALSWFFGVSQNTLNKFGNLTLENSLPFSYIYDMGVLYDDAFNQEADTFSLEIPFGDSTITILSTAQLEAISFQDLVKTVMGAIAIFLTALIIYRKLLYIHDKREIIDKE